MQNIVYGQYLPDVLGPETVARFDLGLRESVYNPDTNPSIINAFATAAYRFGHSMIRNMVMIKEISSGAETFYREDYSEYVNSKVLYN